VVAIHKKAASPNFKKSGLAALFEEHTYLVSVNAVMPERFQIEFLLQDRRINSFRYEG
jgi:hypothetical protein